MAPQARDQRPGERPGHPLSDERDDEPIVYCAWDGTWWAGRYVGALSFEGHRLTIEPRFGLSTLRNWLFEATSVVLTESPGQLRQDESFIVQLLATVWAHGFVEAARHGLPALRRRLPPKAQPFADDWMFALLSGCSHREVVNWCRSGQNALWFTPPRMPSYPHTVFFGAGCPMKNGFRNGPKSCYPISWQSPVHDHACRPKQSLIVSGTHRLPQALPLSPNCHARSRIAVACRLISRPMAKQKACYSTSRSFGRCMF